MSARILGLDGLWRDDGWRVLGADEPVDPRALLPLPRWLAAHEADGLWLAPSDDPAALGARIGELRRVAIDFPRFTDGRGYSIAHTLRRQGYAGELRAVGEVLIDQVFLLKRVGFTQFALRADQDPDAARAALDRYSIAYQGSASEPLPAFRRHVRAAAGASR